MATKKTTTPQTTPQAKSAELHGAPVENATPEHEFDDATIDVGATGALAAIQRTPADRQEQLVAAWVARRNAAAIAEIAAVDAAPPVARRAARRAIGVLKSRGVAIPERGPVVAQPLQKGPATFEARFMFPDAKGAQLWWIARIEKTGRTEVVEVTTLDRQGVVGINRGQPTAGNLRQIWQGWQARVGRMPTEVPLEWARWRLSEARKLSESKKQVMPQGLDAAKDLLDGAPKTAPKHPIELEELALPTDEAAVKARLEKSMHLHEQPEFGPWLPDDAVAIEVLQTVSQRINAMPEEERRDPAKVDVVVTSAIEEAADAYFDDDRKRLYVARLHDAAWSLYGAGLVDRAIDVLLVAKAIAKAGIMSDRASEVPFVRGLFIKLLAVAQQRAGAMAPSNNAEAARLEGRG